MRFGLVLSWGLYDLANQFFVLNIVSLYFIRWLTLEKQTPELFYSIAFGISNFFIACLGPVLGAFSDISGKRRPYLVWLTLLCVAFTAALAASENIILCLVFFAIANFGCQAATVFYNALMKNIATEKNLGLVSGIGKMLSYFGAIIAIQVMKPLVAQSGYRAIFLPTAFLFLLFALPCMLFVRDQKGDSDRFSAKNGRCPPFRRLKETIFGINKFPGLADFLKGSFFGLCAVNVVIVFMSVYATRAFGLNENQVVDLISFSTLFAILGSLASGVLSDRFGHRNSFIVIFIMWILCFLGGALGRHTAAYWLTGALAGASLGATWVVSRALAIRLVPQEKMGEVFGLFNLIGYAAAIVGTFCWGMMLLWLGYRATLLAQSLFMLAGIIFLLRIPDKRGANHG